MADEPKGLSGPSHAPCVELTVPAGVTAVRLDAYLPEALRKMTAVPDGASVSRARLRKLIDAGEVAVNGRPARAKDPVTAGDMIALRWVAQPPQSLVPVPMTLHILYEDAHLMVLDKPAGISMHPGAGETGPTIVQGVLHHVHARGALGLPSSSGLDAWARPGIVHRLDKDTSGAVVVAKTEAAHAGLAQQFHDKTNLREYVALLDGVLNRPIVDHTSYLRRDPTHRLRFAPVGLAEYEKMAKSAAKDAARQLQGLRLARSTFFTELVYAGRLSLVRVRLATGRTHQIRVHARELGVPLIGDPLYHRPVQLPQTFATPVREAVHAANRQMLHARILGFTHPVSGARLSFVAPYPADLRLLLEHLAGYGQAP